MNKDEVLGNKKLLISIHEEAVSNQDIDTCYSHCLYKSLMSFGMEDDDAFDLSSHLSNSLNAHEMLINRLIKELPDGGE
jgi:hypothetical protein